MSMSMDASARLSAPSVNNSVSESKTELQTVLDAIMDGACGLDAYGRATFCNDALLRMTGTGRRRSSGITFMTCYITAGTTEGVIRQSSVSCGRERESIKRSLSSGNIFGGRMGRAFRRNTHCVLCRIHKTRPAMCSPSGTFPTVSKRKSCWCIERRCFAGFWPMRRMSPGPLTARAAPSISVPK
jgi:hypothetical protein